MSKVSVIIPTYNQADLLPRAIESALNQTHAHVEVIVVDDGSTDDTEGVVRPFLEDGRFRYVKQENRGVAAARNRGLSECEGDYVNFLDSDDWLHPQMLSELAPILDEDPSLAFAYCDMIRVDEQGRESFDYSVGRLRGPLSGDIFPTLLRNGYFGVHCVLVRRSIVEEAAGFDEALGGCADYDLWLRITAVGGPARYLDRRLVYYQKRSDSMSRDTEHMEQARQAALRKIMRLHPERCADALALAQRDYEDAWAKVREIAEEKNRLCGEIHRLQAYELSYNYIMNKPAMRAYMALKRGLGRLSPGRAPERGGPEHD